MKISRSSRTTAKKPTETHNPLILVRLILCWGSMGPDGAAACSGAVGGGIGDWRSDASPPAPFPVVVGCGSVVI